MLQWSIDKTYSSLWSYTKNLYMYATAGKSNFFWKNYTLYAYIYEKLSLKRLPLGQWSLKVTSLCWPLQCLDHYYKVQWVPAWSSMVPARDVNKKSFFTRCKRSTVSEMLMMHPKTLALFCHYWQICLHMVNYNQYTFSLTLCLSSMSSFINSLQNFMII